MTDREGGGQVFESGDITAAIVTLGGKSSDVGKTMCTDGTLCVIEVGGLVKFGV